MCFSLLLQAEEKPDPGRNVTDQEKRYLQCMGEGWRVRGGEC